MVASAAATAASDNWITQVTALAASFTGIGQTLDEAYPDDLQTTLLGIELARSRIFRQIHDQRQADLIDYPVSRAVNDAIRYHGVCNLEEGDAEASKATSTVIQQTTGQQPTPGAQAQGTQEQTQGAQEQTQ